MKFCVKLAKCNIHLCYFLHKVQILNPSCHKWPAYTVIWIRFIFTDTRAHFLWEIDQSGRRTAPLPQQSPTLPQARPTPMHSRTWSSFHPLSGLRTLLLIHHLSGSSIQFTIHFRSGLKHQFTIHPCSCREHRFFLIAGISHPSILCIKKKAHQRVHFEKNNKKHGSGLYLLVHERISWQKLTKVGEGLSLSYSNPPHYHKPYIQPAIQELSPASITWVVWGPCCSYIAWVVQVSGLPSISAVVSNIRLPSISEAISTIVFPPSPA